MSEQRNEQISDEDRIDFNLLKNQLASIDGTQATNKNVWPLRLNTVLISHYIFGDVIGRGSYAEVRECIDTKTLRRCAVKIIDKNYLLRQAPKALYNQMQEIRLLKRLKHQNIISLIEHKSEGSRVYIFLEHCTFILSELLAEQNEGRFHCSQMIRNLFEQLSTGISYLHSIGIVHRDIKPQNMLIAHCGTLKLIDFGVSQILSMWTQSDTCSNNEGSPLFQAPEVVSGQLDYPGFKVDVWSAGVTLYLMLFGRYPFNDEALLGLYDRILSEELSIPDDIDIPCKLMAADLIASMLDKDHRKRASIDEVLEHPWLKLNHSVNHDGPSLYDQRHSDFLELTQRRRLSLNGQLDNNRLRDIYESMSVIPYLHNHHFPNVRVVSTSSKNSIISSPARSQSEAPSSRSSTASSASDHPSDGSPPQVDPHEIADIVDDKYGNEPTGNNIEWGTVEEYNLFKVPVIRANRIKPIFSSSNLIGSELNSSLTDNDQQPPP